MNLGFDDAHEYSYGKTLCVASRLDQANNITQCRLFCHQLILLLVPTVLSFQKAHLLSFSGYLSSRFMLKNLNSFIRQVQLSISMVALTQVHYFCCSLLVVTGLEESRPTSHTGRLQQAQPQHQTPYHYPHGCATSCHSHIISPHGTSPAPNPSRCNDTEHVHCPDGRPGQPGGRARPCRSTWTGCRHDGVQEVSCIDRGGQRPQGRAVP